MQKNTLVYESGAQMGQNQAKIGWQKCHDTVPLSLKLHTASCIRYNACLLHQPKNCFIIESRESEKPRAVNSAELRIRIRTKKITSGSYLYTDLNDNEVLTLLTRKKQKLSSSQKNSKKEFLVYKFLYWNQGKIDVKVLYNRKSSFGGRGRIGACWLYDRTKEHILSSSRDDPRRVFWQVALPFLRCVLFIIKIVFT